ncbi:MAG TPA: hypothetical protein VGM41_16585 [Chitinophagaceae bacterium]|jgi:hypothetical protein
MENNFSFIELHIIRMQMSRRSVEDIAVLLGKPFQQVSDYVRAITKGNPTEYELKHPPKLPKPKKEKKIISKIIRRGPAGKGRPAPKVERSYKTIDRDMTSMVSIRIDRKTVVFAKAGSDLDAIRRKYLERAPGFLQPDNPSKVVSKFK